MSTQQPRRIDRRTAEHLLGQAPMGIRNGHPPLAALLPAAAVPGRADELASEQASVAAFRAAHLSPAPQPGRLRMIKATVMKLLTVKVLAIGAATAVGGVALAATTSTLPNPLAKPTPSASSELSEAHPTAKSSRAAHKPDDTEASKESKESKEPKESKDSKGADASKGPSPSLVGLCHAYSAGNKAERGKALENPAFSVLITTAGGKDKVELFCQALLATPAPANSDAGQHGGGTDKAHPTEEPAKPSTTPKR
jgi:hypothetical protein